MSEKRKKDEIAYKLFEKEQKQLNRKSLIKKWNKMHKKNKKKWYQKADLIQKEFDQQLIDYKKENEKIKQKNKKQLNLLRKLKKQTKKNNNKPLSFPVPVFQISTPTMNFANIGNILNDILDESSSTESDIIVNNENLISDIQYMSDSNDTSHTSDSNSSNTSSSNSDCNLSNTSSNNNPPPRPPLPKKEKIFKPNQSKKRKNENNNFERPLKRQKIVHINIDNNQQYYRKDDKKDNDNFDIDIDIP